MFNSIHIRVLLLSFDFLKAMIKFKLLGVNYEAENSCLKQCLVICQYPQGKGFKYALHIFEKWKKNMSQMFNAN